MSIIDLNPLNTVVARLEGVADRLERASGRPAPAATGAAAAAQQKSTAPAASPASEEPPIAKAYDAFFAARLPPLESAAKALAVKDVDEATEMVVEAFKMIKELIVATGRCTKPEAADWAKILDPIMQMGNKAQKACDNRSEFFQNRKAAAEVLNAVSFVAQVSPPGHLQNVLETMDFHAIKVMQKKNPLETTWIKEVKSLVSEFKEFCSNECKVGLTWSGAGSAVEYFANQPLGTGGAKGGFAPPARPAGGGGMGAIFGAIDGFSTGALKKVTADMKTKNRPKEDAPAPVPAAAPKPATAAPKFQGGRKGPKGPPILELQRDTHWMVENQEGRKDIVLEEAGPKELVCVINCKNCNVKVPSKVKSISVDGCERVNLICNGVLSTVELVNSDRCMVQTLGKVMSFAIDKCNGVNVFVSKDSMEAEFVTSKSSEMNITIPEDDGELTEIPIPEQFVTKISGPKSLKTEVSGIYSG